MMVSDKPQRQPIAHPVGEEGLQTIRHGAGIYIPNAKWMHQEARLQSEVAN
jgi:hypothetical protein